MLLHFIFVVKQEDLEPRLWEFEYVVQMAQFYKSWIEKTFSKQVEVQADQMSVKHSRLFNRVNVNTLLDDHRRRGNGIHHFYLCYFRPIWTDCTCEGYHAENFGMVWWQQGSNKNDIQFLSEKNKETQLIHGENFSGVLAILLWPFLKKDIQNNFTKMNKALKTYVEDRKSVV